MGNQDASLFLRYFRGRAGIHASRDEAGRYSPVDGEPDIAGHLDGKSAVGFYLMSPDSSVFCSCADIDDHDHSNPEWVTQADAVCQALRELGAPYARETSQSGSGSHIWLFFEDAVPSYLVRAFWRVVTMQSRVALPEVYPRQDRLTGKGLGNLVLYPLWSRSQFTDDRLEVISAEEALDGKMIANPVGYLKSTVHSVMGAVPSEPRLVTKPDQLPERVEKLMVPGSLLESRWNGDMSGLADRSRSAVCFAIASICVQARVPTPEIEQTVRAWAILNGYTSRATPDWIERTVRRSYDEVVERGEAKSEGVETLLTSAREALHEQIRGNKMLFRTGIKGLDESIDGCQQGEFVVVGGRPSQCKTALALHIIDTVSRDYPSLFISEEMSRRELGKRAIMSISRSRESEWDITKTDKLLAEHYSARKNIYAVENAATIERCEELIDQYVSSYGVKFVVIDYLQLLSRRKATGRYEDLTDISRRLKQIAGRLGIGVLALCQLNRAIESRESRIPQLADIKESGQIEQDADLVLILQWPDRSKPDFRIWCLKRRNGPIRHQLVQTTFNPNSQRFDDG